MTDDDAEIQATSDRLLAEVRRLRAAEERKRQEPVSSPEFHRLAAEVEEQARAVWQTADEQRRIGREAGRREESIDDISARRHHEEDTQEDQRTPTSGHEADTQEDLRASTSGHEEDTQEDLRAPGHEAEAS